MANADCGGNETDMHAGRDSIETGADWGGIHDCRDR